MTLGPLEPESLVMHSCCTLLSSLASAAIIVPLTEATPRTDCGVL
jgi:hypothetical protein